MEYLDLILLAVVGYALVIAFLLVLFRMSSDKDREARHAEKELIPFSDVTITHHGH